MYVCMYLMIGKGQIAQKRPYLPKKDHIKSIKDHIKSINLIMRRYNVDKLTHLEYEFVDNINECNS